MGHIVTATGTLTKRIARWTTPVLKLEQGNTFSAGTKTKDVVRINIIVTVLEEFVNQTRRPALIFVGMTTTERLNTTLCM